MAMFEATIVICLETFLTLVRRGSGVKSFPERDHSSFPLEVNASERLKTFEMVFYSDVKDRSADLAQHSQAWRRASPP